MKKILSKEQLCYLENMTPELYADKDEAMKWWKLKLSYSNREMLADVKTHKKNIINLKKLWI